MPIMSSMPRGKHMYNVPKCPWCGTELEETYHDKNVYRCEACNDLFYYDPNSGDIVHYEPYPDDDYALADFCRGGDLSEEG